VEITVTAPIRATLEARHGSYLIMHPDDPHPEPMVILRHAWEPHRATGWVRIIPCDGCGLIGRPEEEYSYDKGMVQPVRPDICQAVYGRTDLVYLLCPPSTEGRHPCLDLADLADELHDRVRCRTPGCDGTRCAG
jgi:hypothetical protein